MQILHQLAKICQKYENEQDYLFLYNIKDQHERIENTKDINGDDKVHHHAQHLQVKNLIKKDPETMIPEKVISQNSSPPFFSGFGFYNQFSLNSDLVVISGIR